MQGTTVLFKVPKTDIQPYTRFMNKPTLIKTFANEENGIEAIVTEIASGFSVAIKDTDSGEFFPTINIYKTKEQALTVAEKAAA